MEPARRLTTRPPGPSRWHGGSLRAPAAGSSARTPATTSCRSRTRSTSRGDGGLELDDGAVKEMDDWLDGDPGAWLVFSAARDERGERRGAVRARFIAVAAAWSARRSERARRRRVSRRGRQGAVAGGNSEAGGHGRLWFWPPGWNMEGGGCGFGGHRPQIASSAQRPPRLAQTCCFFLGGKKNTGLLWPIKSTSVFFTKKNVNISV